MIKMNKLPVAIAAALLSLPAHAAYDVKDLKLGATEADVRRVLPSAHCKALEWKSKAADRRCDDSRVVFGGVELRVTLYLRKDVVEAFDVRFDTKELERFVAFLLEHLGGAFPTWMAPVQVAIIPVSVGEAFLDFGRRDRQEVRELHRLRLGG